MDEDLDAKNEKLATSFLKEYSRGGKAAKKASLCQYVMQKVHSYKSGDFFGNLALFNHKNRASTIIATSECHFGVLGKDEFRKMLSKFELRRILTNIELLENLPFFAHWSKNQLKKLLPSLNIVVATRG